MVEQTIEFISREEWQATTQPGDPGAIA